MAHLRSRMGLAAALAIVPCGGAAQSTPAGVLSGPAAVSLARQHPDTARERFRRELASAATVASPAGRESALRSARALAVGYADAWRDSLLVREMLRFDRWSPRDRIVKARADSLRRAGFEAFPSEGPDSALRLWERSRLLAASIGDSTGLAAVLGNLGAGFLTVGELDSAGLHLARSRVLAERVRDWRTLGNTFGLIGSLAKARGDYAAARDAYVRALAIRGRSGDDRGAAADENNLGLLAQTLGDSAAARRSFEAALARNRRAGRDGPAAVNHANLATLEIVAGRYERAMSRYRQALSLHRRAGEDAEAGLDLRSIGGLHLNQGDYAPAIASLTEAVAILRRTGPLDDLVAAESELVQAYAAAGHLDEAHRILERSERSLRADDPDLLALLALGRGDLAIDANALRDAQAAYVRAESLYAVADDPAGVAEARKGLGALQLRRGDRAGAALTLALAADAQREAGDDRGAALTALLLGAAQAELGDAAAALATTRAAQRELQALGDPVAEASAFAALGELAEAAGNSAGAEAAYRRGVARLSGRTAPGVDAALRWGLGRVLRARGDLAGSARELGGAIDAIEGMAGGLATGVHRWSLLGSAAELHAELALVEHARGRDAAAFEASERLRGRQLRELIRRGAPTPPPRTDPALARRERELRSHIAALERGSSAGPVRTAMLRDMAPAPLGPRDADAIGAARTDYATLVRSLETTSPEYAGLLTAPRVSHREVAARLRPDEALLEYLVTDSLTLIFVVTRDSTRVIRSPVGRRELAAAVDFSRAAIQAAPSSRAPEPWGPALRRLHRLLIEPAERTGLLRAARTLLVAPHAELHFLPFAALMPGPSGSYLIQRYDLAYVPSAAIWLELGARGRAPETSTVLAFAPFPGSLPGSRDEVRAIGRIHGAGATVVIGAGATESAFRLEAPRHSIIHLASYGVLNRHNPLSSFVAFAPERADPGRLDVHEVFGLSLRARLLILGACETGLASGADADVPAGDDWVGLVRAFLFAGADNVMGTLWPIEDRATAQLVPLLHRTLQGKEPVPALALVQRQALRDMRMSAPRHWAAFAIVGAAR